VSSICRPRNPSSHEYTNPAVSGNWLSSQLECPRCGTHLESQPHGCRCGGCRAWYPVADEILDVHPPGDLQESHYEHDVDGHWEETRPAAAPVLHAWILYSKLDLALGLLPFPLGSVSVLNVCSGSGMDAEYLADQGAFVTLLDISNAALERARRRFRRAGLGFSGVRASVDRIPLCDQSVDIAFVHDGLHHLADPLGAVDEMCRVAARAVLILEPAASTATDFAVKLGLADTVEEAGNEVRRFAADELVARLSANGFSHVCVVRRFVRQHHFPTWLERAFSLPGMFVVGRTAYVLAGRLFAPVGNKLTVVAWR
jgi:SAM-dependent methyltransferase